MAEYQPFQDNPETKGVNYPQDYSLNKLNFITVAKETFDLRKLVTEFCYYEDLYSFVTSGYVTLTDAQGFIELLQLTGSEYIEVDFGKTKEAPDGVNLIKTFRVYKISQRTPAENQNAEFYRIHFVSDEMMLSEQTKITKSYTGIKISDNIYSILRDKLNVDSSRIETIEETTGIYDFVVTNLKPLESISWMSNYARPKSTGFVGADMLFFETKNGFNFRSLQSMYGGEVYGTYKYQAKNVDNSMIGMQGKVSTVLDYEIVKAFDMMNDISSGTFASKTISLDPLTRTKRITTFDYLNYLNSSDSLNKNPVPQVNNKFGKTQSESSDSVVKLVVSNSNQKDIEYIRTNDAVKRDIFIENFVPNRTAQLALANYTVLKLVIPGDSGITVGRTINFELSTLKPTTSSKDLDKFYSGKYLISAVRHVAISPNYFQTILEITKDSSSTPYVERDFDSPQDSITSKTNFLNTLFK